MKWMGQQKETKETEQADKQRYNICSEESLFSLLPSVQNRDRSLGWCPLRGRGFGAQARRDEVFGTAGDD
jgi:hypothetical protein